MFRFLRNSVIVFALLLSLTLNAALVVSEVAYNIAYSLISNAASIIYDGAELTYSIGWKNKNAATNLEDLRVKRDVAKAKISKLEKNLAASKATTSELSEDLAKRADEIKALSNKVLALDKQIAKSTDDIAVLTKKSLTQVSELGSTRKIVRETTDRATKRIAQRVARNIAAMPFESVPVAGVAITVGTIYLEIQDACTTMREFGDMTSTIGLDEDTAAVDKSFCSLSKDDLYRLITNRTNDFEECISQITEESSSNVDELMNCLPKPIDDLSIPERDDFDMPKPAQF